MNTILKRNQIIPVLTTLLLLLSLFSCSEEEFPAGAQLSFIRQNLRILDTSVSFGYNTNLSATINVEGENAPWKLENLPSWITASATSGKGVATIILNAKENTSVDDARAAVVTFTSTSADYQYSRTISVSQPTADIYINPSPQTISCLPKGDSKEIAIDSNVDWTATCSASWIKLSKTGDKQLHVTVEENLGITHSATIYLKRSGTDTVVKTISVTQAGSRVTGSTSNIPFIVGGETKTTTIEAEASWTADVSDASWLSVKPSGGSAGSATLSITATANTSASSHSGFVYVRIGNTKKLAIPVSQEGVMYSVSPSSITLRSTTEPAAVNVTANAAWKVVSNPEWLTAELPETLVGTVSLILTPQDNPNTTPRTGQVVIGRDGFSGNKTITVTQEGKTFGDLADQMNFPITAATQSLTIETDGTWTVATTDSWIHPSPLSGQGRGQLQVSVDANPGNDERRGSLTVTVGQTSQTIAIVQVGHYITLSCDDVITKSTPTTVHLSVASNMEWTASSNVDWMTVEPKQGEADAELTISVKDNPSTKERTGIITVKSGEVTQDFSFTQPGRQLSVSTTEISSPASGYTTSPIIVSTDGSYEVNVSDDWLTIAKDGTSFTVTVDKTNTVQTREGYVTVALTGLNEGETLEHSIKVTQSGMNLEVSSESLTFPHEGGTSNAIIVTTVGTFTVTPSEAWLTINRSGNTFTVEASENTGDKRDATIVVEVNGLKTGESLKRTINVTQAQYVVPDPLGLCPDIEHPHMIDLGLPSGTLWACCNVGASSPEKYGDYFAWGETEPKSEYDWSTYKWCNGSYNTITKYCHDYTNGYNDFRDDKTELEPEDDAATANWGSGWQMPTYNQFSELISDYISIELKHTTIEWTTLNGINGIKITSKSNGRSIFLPAAGLCDDTSLTNAGSYGYYWVRLSNNYGSYFAQRMNFNSSSADMFTVVRCCGQSVRPVRVQE